MLLYVTQDGDNGKGIEQGREQNNELKKWALAQNGGDS